MSHSPPLFVPFNVRNEIINENCTGKKDIIELDNQYQVLTSYMKEKEIYNGINDRLSKLYTSKKRVNFTVSNSIDSFKKNQVTTRYGLLREIFNSHKSSNLSMIIGFPFPAFSNPQLNRGISDTGLKAYWKFNEASGNIINQSQSAVDLGSAADMVITGMTYNQASGPFNYSGLFDVVNDFGVVGSADQSIFNFMHNTTALSTIAFWAKWNDRTGNQQILAELTSSTQIGIFVWKPNTTNTLKYAIFRGSSGTSVIDVTSTNDFIPDATTWHFYAFTYDQSLGSNNLKIYRDDANLEQFTKTADAPSDSNSSLAFNFMREPSGALFAGLNTAEWSIWNNISTTRNTQLYNGGNGRPIY